MAKKRKKDVLRTIREVGPLYRQHARCTIYEGDCLEFVSALKPESVHLIVTSPPYNVGKKYERRKTLEQYLEEQERVIAACARALALRGSICWQVGNHVNRGEVFPLDALLYPLFKKQGLQLRNRIIWHFEHGLHCRRRFSGRYETILWFTKTSDYYFDLDPVRVPQKYPGKKYFKGPNAGQYSCNPLGKNPGDLWVIPNVKHNHIEKTAHPCQFPVELVERLLLSMTKPGDVVLDPYLGVGSTAVAAILHDRIALGAEIVPEYVRIAQSRVQEAFDGTIRVRPRNRPVYTPSRTSSVARAPVHGDQLPLPKA